MKLRIRFRLVKPMGRVTLDVTSDEFEVLNYTLYGTESRNPYSLATLGAGTLPLPDVVERPAGIPDGVHLDLAGMDEALNATRVKIEEQIRSASRGADTIVCVFQRHDRA